MADSIPRIALFVDAENLFIEANKAALPSDLEPLLARIREEGQLVLARAYADWTRYPAHNQVQKMQQQVIEMVMLPTDLRNKNTADIQIVVDALELTILPNSPDTIALVAGDRDFVPLVQRIKRYGKTVIGMGLRGSTSPALEKACTKFWYYEDLFPELKNVEAASSSPVQQPEAVSAELALAFELLIKAARALQRQDKPVLGASLKPMMQQLDPTFDLGRFRFMTFKEFVSAAHGAGYVRQKQSDLNHLDFTIDVLKEPTVVHSFIEQPTEGTRFDSDERALQSYRSILERKRVPLIPWDERKLLVEGLVAECRERGAPMPIAEMSRIMQDISARNFLRVPERAVQKLTYTMNIAQVFSRDGFAGFIDDFMHAPVSFAYDAEEVLLRMNATYLRGIKIDDPNAQFRISAVSRLLFESENPSDQARTADVLHFLDTAGR